MGLADVMAFLHGLGCKTTSQGWCPTCCAATVMPGLRPSRPWAAPFSRYRRPPSSLLLHNLRESYRMWCWSVHHAHGLCDSFAESRYKADLCHADLFPQFQVLSGGTISPACVSRMRKHQVAECFECHEAITIEQAWTCPLFHAMRVSCLGSTNMPPCFFRPPHRLGRH